MNLKRDLEDHKIRELKEKVESDPKEQKIKELQKEVNVLVDLVLAMQNLRHKHHEWLDHCLTYLNKPKPEGYELKEKQLLEDYSKSIEEYNRLVAKSTSVTQKQ